MREKMDPGNWELRLSGSFGTTATDNGIVKLIDDSNATTDPSVQEHKRYSMLLVVLLQPVILYLIVIPIHLVYFFQITELLFYLKMS